MRQEKICVGSAGLAIVLAGSAPYSVVTLSRVIVRQWLRPVSAAVQRSMREKRPSIRGRYRAIWNGCAVHRPGYRLPVACRVQDGYQVFRAGQDEDVRLVAVTVEREPFVGLAGDRWQAQAPAEPERSVAGAGVVGELEAGCKAGPSGAHGERDRHGGGAGGRADRELLA